MVSIDRIATRTGDDGSTARADGSRVLKHHPLMEAIGSIDEANCAIGLVRCESLPTDLNAALAQVQHDLFDCGADLASPPGGAHEARIPRIVAAQLARLDRQLDEAVQRLPPLTSFVLPGGTRAAALLHQARVVTRRAERAVVAAGQAGEPISALCRQYLNRLSDCLFAWSRIANDLGQRDVLWQPGINR